MSQSSDYLDMRKRYAALCRGGKEQNQQGHAKALADFDAFCANKKVAYVAVDAVSFAFTTHRLVMHGPEGPRWLGEIGVRIMPANTSIACIDIHNLDKHAHPHVHSGPSRHPCLGTANQIHVAMLFGNRRLAGLGLFMIRFLEIYGPNSHACYPSNWPLLTAQEIEKWKAEQ